MSVGLAASPRAGAVLASLAWIGFALARGRQQLSKQSSTARNGFAGHRGRLDSDAGAGLKYALDIFK